MREVANMSLQEIENELRGLIADCGKDILEPEQRTLCLVDYLFRKMAEKRKWEAKSFWERDTIYGP